MTETIIADSYVSGLPASDFVAYTTGNGGAPTIPAGTLAGDWLILMIVNGNGNLTGDSNWNAYLEEAVAGQSQGGGMQSWLYVKPAITSEPTTTFSTTDGSTRWVMMSYRGGGKPLILAGSELFSGIGTTYGLPATSMAGIPFDGKLLHIIGVGSNDDPNGLQPISGATSRAVGINSSNANWGIRGADEPVLSGDVIARTATFSQPAASYVSYALLFPSDVTKTKWPRIKAVGSTAANAASHSVTIPAASIAVGDLIVGMCWKTAAAISSKPAALTDLVPITSIPAFGSYSAGVHCGYKIADATDATSGITLTWTTGSQVGGCLYAVIKDTHHTNPIAANGSSVNNATAIPAVSAPAGEAAAAIFIGLASSGGSGGGQMNSPGTWTRIRQNGGDNYGWGFLSSTAAIEPGGSTGPEARTVYQHTDGPTWLTKAVLLRPET